MNAFLLGALSISMSLVAVALVVVNFTKPHQKKLSTLTYHQFKNVISHLLMQHTGIPKLVFRTGPFPLYKAPEVVINYLEDLVKKNPEYTQVYFNDEDCKEFVKVYFPEHLQAYNALIPTAFKADLFRLLVLYQFGGVYNDIGHLYVQPISTVIQDGDELVFAIDHPLQNSGGLHNAFIASISGHPIIKKAIERIVHNVMTRSYGENQYDITGPVALGKCVNEFFDKPSKAPFTKGYTHYKGFTLKFVDYALGHVPHLNMPKNILDLDGNVAIVTKFPNYYNIMYSDRNTLHYDELYKQKVVYKF
ncbi:hypothetical protein EB118_02235 [bacterium]|nr:hypothetical protein [bacterium]NDC93930.1 hypothetical protein [bacterium]NDD83237.1 hypothetical protein [bacterium]NDG28907.1 hypothetical protein [bacterium]